MENGSALDELEGGVLEIADSTYGSDILSRLNTARMQHLFTDIILCAQDKEFPCHRNVLAMSSPYFSAMFSNELREKKQTKITISDLQPSTLALLLDYAYSGCLTIDKENSQELLVAANMFNYPVIVESCCKFLLKQLHPSNCLGIEEFAQLHSCSDLELAARRFCLENFVSVSECEEFLELPLERLTRLLDSDALEVRAEEAVFESAVRWVCADRAARARHLAALLARVRLGAVRSEYLESVIARHDLVLSDHRCVTIVDNVRRLVAAQRDTKLLEDGGQLCSSDPPSTDSEAGGDDVTHVTRDLGTMTLLLTPRPSTLARELMVVTGGLGTGSSVLKQTELYDPLKRCWRPLPDLPEDLSFFSVAVLRNRLYVTGGIADGRVSRKVHVFDAVQGWTPGKPMMTSRARHASVVWNDCLFVLGGIREGSLGRIEPVDVVECVRPGGEWQRAGRAPYPRTQARVVPHLQTLVEVGGTQNNAKVKVMDTYKCDPDYKVTHSGEQYVLPDLLQYAQIIPLNDVFFIIWEDSRKLIELNPAKRTWRPRAEMRAQHLHSGAAALHGRIYVTGGMSAQQPSAAVEVYDPGTDTWAAGPPMTRARACHGAATMRMT